MKWPAAWSEKMTETLQFIELPPFNSFVVDGKSSWTFGVKEFFTKPDYNLEVIVSEKQKAQILEKIIRLESARSATDAVLQGVGGAGTGVGVMTAAGAIGSCPACYPVYAAFAPFVAIGGASLATVPAIYTVFKRLGQRRIMQSLAQVEMLDVKLSNYEPLIEIISEQDLEYHIREVKQIKSLPRRQRDKEILTEHKSRAYKGLLALQEQSLEMDYEILANAYGYVAREFGKDRSTSSPVIIKPVQYKPVSKKTFVFAAAGAAILVTGGILWATGTNPLNYLPIPK